MNPCDPNPCHKGRCVVERDEKNCTTGFLCRCPQYYEGELCEIGEWILDIRPYIIKQIEFWPLINLEVF